MKNIKLLLATTAMLSMGLISTNVRALEHSNYSSVILHGQVNLATPITAEEIDDLRFGVLDATTIAGKTLTISTDGTYSGTAKVLSDGGDSPLHPGKIEFTGANLNDGEHSPIVLHLDGKEIEMKESHNGVSGKLCGKIINLSQGDGSFDSDNHTYTLYVGGTLEFEDDYTPTNTQWGSCMGNVTLTYIYNENQ